ncbi:MAG TPA: ribosome biogenesis GTPase YlqF [Polyangiales bacterium]|nr:ribosome biogenesis GTPase YlqF [Polyangiales bacterium]
MSVQWFPGHMTKALRELSALVPSQDVIIEVIDARLPASSSNPILSELRGQKPCIKVLSKSDLADPALTDAWLRYFDDQPNVSALASSNDDRHTTRQRIAKLSRDAALTRGPSKEVRALIAGVPNVGKSTLINTLMQRTVANVSDKPAVTKEQQTVILRDGTLLTDSPGVTWPKMEDESGALRLAFAGSIPDTAIDYLNVATFGAQLLLERYAALVVTRYKLKQTPESPTALLTEIGKRRGGLRPGGIVDLHKAAEILVHEFRAGTLGRVTLEAPPS